MAGRLVRGYTVVYTSEPSMALPALLLWSAAFAHPADSCAETRRVRELAVAAALDTTTLDVLVQRTCGTSTRPARPRPTPHTAAPGPSQDCVKAGILVTLAKVDGLGADALAEVVDARRFACRDGGSLPTRWSSHLTAAQEDGDISWPSGIRARSSDGDWYYPSGIKAADGDGDWYYPSGIKAADSDSDWYHPSGVRAGRALDAVRVACSEAPALCERRLDRIDRLSGQAKKAVIVALVYAAHNN